jgi:tetratricopeptide (TPR) repeat protein
MQKILILYLICFNLVASAQETKDQITTKVFNEKFVFDRALKHYHEKNFKESILLFKQLIERNESQVLYWFNLGNAALMTKDFELAASSYSKVISLKSKLAPAADFYLAKVFIYTGRFKEAQKHLEALATKELPVNLKSQVDNEQAILIEAEDDTSLLAAIYYEVGRYQDSILVLSLIEKHGEQEKLLMAMNEVKLKKTETAQLVLENLIKTSENEKIIESAKLLLEELKEINEPVIEESWTRFGLEQAFGNSNNLFASGRSEDKTDGSYSQTTGEFDWTFKRSDTFNARMEFMASLFEVFGESQLQTQFYNLLIPLRIRTENKWDYTFRPTYEYQIWDNDPALSAYGMSAKFQKMQTIGYGIDLSILKQQSENADIDYLDGNIYFGRLFLNMVASWVTLNIYGEYGKNNIQDLPIGDDTLPLRHTWYGPGVRLYLNFTDWFFASLSFSTMTRDYENETKETNKSRKDQMQNTSLRLNFGLNDNVSIFIQHLNSQNKSTLTADDVRDKNMKIQNTLIGLSWESL